MLICGYVWGVRLVCSSDGNVIMSIPSMNSVYVNETGKGSFHPHSYIHCPHGSSMADLDHPNKFQANLMSVVAAPAPRALRRSIRGFSLGISRRRSLINNYWHCGSCASFSSFWELWTGKIRLRGGDRAGLAHDVAIAANFKSSSNHVTANRTAPVAQMRCA
jgi:hypothetical protein